MDPGEYLHEAAIREVFEETGVKTEFISILSMRHMNSTPHSSHFLIFASIILRFRSVFAFNFISPNTGVFPANRTLICCLPMSDARMGNGDLYITCLLKALTTTIVIQEDEIAEARWMPVLPSSPFHASSTSFPILYLLTFVLGINLIALYIDR